MSVLLQIAALPIRRAEDGGFEVLLVTSRETRRWVIPKGWPWPGLDDHKAAAEEAREEAGALGSPHTEPLGTFTYIKRRQRDAVHVTVSVFRFDVEEMLDAWPESHQRQRAWFRPEDAANLVEETELKALILAIEA